MLRVSTIQRYALVAALCIPGVGMADAHTTNKFVTLEGALGQRASSPVSISPASWMPNGREFVVSHSSAAPGAVQTIYLFDVENGDPKRLLEGANPKVSPDGKWIAYEGGVGTERQIWIARSSGANARALTRHAGGLQGWYLSFDWSPDSRRIAYCYTPNLLNRDKVSETGATVEVYGDRAFSPPDAEIRLLDIVTSADTQVSKIAGAYTSLSWFGPADRLLVHVYRHAALYRDQDDFSELRLLSIDSREEKILASGGGEEMYGAPAPNARDIAFYYDSGPVAYPAMYEIALVSADGGVVRALTPKIFASRNVRGPVWNSAGSGVLYVMKVGVFSQIFLAHTSGKIQQITSNEAEHAQVSASPVNDLITWSEQSTTGEVRLMLARGDGRDPRVLHRMHIPSDKLQLGLVEHFQWRASDGVRLAGLLVKPPNYVRGRKYPLVVELHGGPFGGQTINGQLLFAGPLERQIWAARGFVVFAPDYRGSGAFGWDLVLQGREAQDFLDRDASDVLSGVDELIKGGSVDPNRMALAGHSYGATLTNWMITRTQRFRAAVSYEGMAEWYISYGSMYSVGGSSYMEWSFKGRPWEVPETYYASSAIYRMKDVKTPTMFIVGDGTQYGGMYPAQYEFMYTALTLQGINSELLLYRGEGHVVEKDANISDLGSRMLEWFERYLGPHSSSASPTIGLMCVDSEHTVLGMLRSSSLPNSVPTCEPSLGA